MRMSAHGTPRRARRIAVASGLAFLVATAALLLWQHERFLAWIRGYEIVWLPPAVIPADLNDEGNAVVYQTVPDDGRLTFGFSDAGYWKREEQKISWMGSLTPGTDKQLKYTRGISDRDRVFVLVTGEESFDLPGRYFLWSPDGSRRELDLPLETYEYFIPTAINDRDCVVGYTTQHLGVVVGDDKAVMWSESTGLVRLHASLQGKKSIAEDINNEGWVAGCVWRSDGRRRPFLWRPEAGMTILPLPGGYTSGGASVVTDGGQILVSVGHDDLAAFSSFSGAPYLWSEEDGFSAIAVPERVRPIFSQGLNENGVVLLEASSEIGPEWFLCIRAGSRRLPDRLDDNSVVWYVGPNDQGWVAGSVREETADGGARKRGFLLRLLR